MVEELLWIMISIVSILLVVLEKVLELSGIIDCTETKGYVYNVKNPEDYAGLFIGGSINLAVGVEGGAIAPALTLNPVYSEIISGEGLGGGAGLGIT